MGLMDRLTGRPLGERGGDSVGRRKLAKMIEVDALRTKTDPAIVMGCPAWRVTADRWSRRSKFPIDRPGGRTMRWAWCSSASLTLVGHFALRARVSTARRLARQRRSIALGGVEIAEQAPDRR
jgi:hypothetical protein